MALRKKPIKPAPRIEGDKAKRPRGKKARVQPENPTRRLVDTELAELRKKMAARGGRGSAAVKKSAKPSAKIGFAARLKGITGRIRGTKKSKSKKVLVPREKIKKPKGKKARVRLEKAVKVEKPAFEGLEVDTELVELQKKMVVRKAAAPMEFEKHTVFKCPAGYKEQERYWITKPYAWVAVLFNPKENERLYYLVEPNLTPSEKTVLEKLHEHLLDRLTYDETVKDRDAYIEDKVNELLSEYEMPIEEETIKKLIYYLKRSYIGYGRIDALLKDPRIEDISCDGLGLPIFLYHQDYQNIRTNVGYDDPIELDLFVGRLVERAGKQISLGKPTVDATLPQGYRLQATIGTEITTKGSTFTIRKYREEPFTPVDLIKFKTFSPEMLAYLWLAAENKKNIMVVGGTASGKTCTLNAISLFMPPDAKIVSIEDTRELSLYQENWVAAVTRPAYGEKAITMYDLLAQALRQRPEIIIVGEVRGPEALSLFQAMTTGHTSYSTMHAGSIQEMVYRLEGEPINVPHHMLASLDIVCIQLLTHFKDVRVRRNQTVLESGGVDQETGALKTNRLFERDSITDKFEKLGDSLILAEIMRERGWSALRLKKELENRQRVLEYLTKKKISGIKEVSKIIRQYYFDPENVMKQVGLK